MKKLAILAAILLPTVWAGTASAAVSLTSLDTPIVLNLNGWAGSLPSDFSLGGASAATTYRGTSATTTGGVYSLSGQGFDYLPSSTATPLTLTGTWQNNTGVTLDTITFSYNAFVVSANTRVPGWAVTSSLGNSTALNWLSSQGTQTLTTTYTGLSIAPGATFTFSFAADRGTGSGSSPMIGLNNLSVTAGSDVSPVPEPHEYGIAISAMLVVMLVLRRTRQQRQA